MVRIIAAALLGGTLLAIAAPASAESSCRNVLGNDNRRRCYQAEDEAAARAQRAAMMRQPVYRAHRVGVFRAAPASAHPAAARR